MSAALRAREKWVGKGGKPGWLVPARGAQLGLAVALAGPPDGHLDHGAAVHGHQPPALGVQRADEGAPHGKLGRLWGEKLAITLAQLFQPGGPDFRLS